MSNTIKFDYDTFYKYYTTDSNLKEDEDPPEIYYYPKTTSKKPKQQTLSKKYITINSDRVHITKIIENDKEALLFSIPELKDKDLNRWDNHFHFGKDNSIQIKNPITNIKEYVPAVYFHKTIQHPEKKGKELINCYFYPEMEMNMNIFENMKCLQRGYKMRELYTKKDFIYIKEIISRPFLEHLVNNNNKKKTFLEALTLGKKPSGKGGTKKKTRRHRRKSVRHNRRR
jgi:hypothetical protein